MLHFMLFPNFLTGAETLICIVILCIRVLFFPPMQLKVAIPIFPRSNPYFQRGWLLLLERYIFVSSIIHFPQFLLRSLIMINKATIYIFYFQVLTLLFLRFGIIYFCPVFLNLANVIKYKQFECCFCFPRRLEYVLIDIKASPSSQLYLLRVKIFKVIGNTQICPRV